MVLDTYHENISHQLGPHLDKEKSLKDLIWLIWNLEYGLHME